MSVWMMWNFHRSKINNTIQNTFWISKNQLAYFSTLNLLNLKIPTLQRLHFVLLSGNIGTLTTFYSYEYIFIQIDEHIVTWEILRVLPVVKKCSFGAYLHMVFKTVSYNLNSIAQIYGQVWNLILTVLPNLLV